MKYLSYYDISIEEGRSFCLAATNKMDYICKAIIENGDDVEIVSASVASNKGYSKGSVQEISKGIKLKKFSAYKWGNIFQKLWVTIYSVFALLFYFLFQTKKGEKILVYHSTSYMRIIAFAKIFKRFKIILEVEEIYGDVMNSTKMVKREMQFFKKADFYIFPTELLNQKINVENKPYIIIHGTYNVEKQIAIKRDDERIHCIYAGTFDPRKGGVAAAAAAGEFLDEKYHVHILGFGEDNDIKCLLRKIDEVNALSKCKVTYDGLLSGEEYIRFIQSCDVGLSTQNPNASFNETSFPSKVLSYLANGLRVVSIKVKALETSDVNDLLYYYSDNNPEEIANAIKSIDLSDDYDSRIRIGKLDKRFKQELKEFLRC